ncbi:flagellin protein [Parvularcula bermudensis HTCC2503]|uniref:Flagellin n=1 Tax=Parvularcula bermudensis (strain ATCC BAA-594 / HTCC2503 / KCTC 12087) TaxID=314260 RepID=E0TH58_PARBH|nr:flagellin [Parvularcula bermudensis]ADM09642.1 flagellin protein [Parvularcula bermudensis HTCC2503]
MSSINFNASASVALRSLQETNRMLETTQQLVSTGKRINSAKDNAAIWSISTIMQADVSSFKSITDSLNLGASTVGVASSASETVVDLLQDMKALIVSAQEENVDRNKIQSDIDALRNQITSTVNSAQFNGLNLLNNSQGTVDILASLNRSSTGNVAPTRITINGQDLTDTQGTSGGSITAGTASTVVAGRRVDESGFTGASNVTDSLRAGGDGTLDLRLTTGVADDLRYFVELDGGARSFWTNTAASGTSVSGIATALEAAAKGALNASTVGTDKIDGEADLEFDATTSGYDAEQGIVGRLTNSSGADVSAQVYTYSASDNNSGTARDAGTTLTGGTDLGTGDEGLTFADVTTGVSAGDVVVFTYNVGDDGNTTDSTIQFAVKANSSGVVTKEAQAEAFTAAFNQLSTDGDLAADDLAGATATNNEDGTVTITDTGNTNSLEFAASNSDEYLVYEQVTTGIDGEIETGSKVIQDADTRVGAVSEYSFEGLTTALAGAGNLYQITIGDSSSSSNTIEYRAKSTDTVSDVLEELATRATGINADIDVTFSGRKLVITNNSTSAVNFEYDVTSGAAGGGLEFLANLDVRTAAGASEALGDIDDMINTATAAASAFGSAARRVDIQMNFLTDLISSLEAGVSALTDADLTAAAADLQALQVQQQLGLQALAIANASPQALLALFQ